MYGIGEIIVYGTIGVCEVIDVAPSTRPNTSKDILYYTLKPLYQDGVIYISVDNDKVFMRRVISREEAEKLIDRIPGIETEFCKTVGRQQLAEHYQTALASHDCGDLIELIMSIYNKKIYAQEHHRHLGQLDARYMKRAEELLYGEFSVALEIPKDDVCGYIATRVGQMSGQ